MYEATEIVCAPLVSRRQPVDEVGHRVVVGEAVTYEQHVEPGTVAAGSRDVASENGRERVADHPRVDETGADEAHEYELGTGEG